jgi:hypothetical protein
MYSLVPVMPSTTTLDNAAAGWVESHRRSGGVSGWPDGVESIPSDGSTCPQMLGAKTIGGEAPAGHSVGAHVGSYRNETFPDALLKLSQPAVGLGVMDALEGDPDAVPALELQAARPAARSNRTPVRTKTRSPGGLFVA